jgi:hypothetical protein
MLKSRKMRWVGHVARMRRRGMHIGYWWESQKERHNYENLDVGGSIILKWTLENGMKWYALVNLALAGNETSGSIKFLEVLE